MQIVKLSDYKVLRVQARPVSEATLRRRARKGGIPGAFQFVHNGDWHVDLDAHDAEIQRRIQDNMIQTAAAPPTEQAATVSQVIGSLGSNEAALVADVLRGFDNATATHP